MDLTARSYNCMRKANIANVAELIATPLERLMQIKNFGKKSAEEINAKLSAYGVQLKGDISVLED